nr:adenylate isopentenyltransferase 5, chloroplastic-like [Ipomoea batatas]
MTVNLSPAQPYPPTGRSRKNLHHLAPAKDKQVVVVFDATGTAKSRLAIDLNARFKAEAAAEEKEKEEDRIPHHRLGVDFTAADFLRRALQAEDSITAKDRLPIIAGGSNAYIFPIDLTACFVKKMVQFEFERNMHHPKPKEAFLKQGVGLQFAPQPRGVDRGRRRRSGGRIFQPQGRGRGTKLAGSQSRNGGSKR